MILYLVKHDSGDYRLHRPDGTELDTWSSDPREGETVANLLDAVAAAHPGASILGDAQARQDFARIVSSDWAYRDVTIPDETVPWE